MLGTILLVFALVFLVLAAFNCPVPPRFNLGWNGLLCGVSVVQRPASGPLKLVLVTVLLVVRVLHRLRARLGGWLRLGIGLNRRVGRCAHGSLPRRVWRA